MEKGYIKNQLQELLNRIPDFFEPDELAYYSAHCKNEQQIRDRIAWQLHKNITLNTQDGDSSPGMGSRWFWEAESRFGHLENGFRER